MKTIKIIFISLLIGMISACSKDIGSYNYHDVNEIIISGLLDGDHPTNRTYQIAIHDTLQLSPILEASVEGADISQLTYSWKVNNVLVSEDKNMTYIANKDYGKLNGEFTVTNLKTGLKSAYHFIVSIINPYKLGYYVLSKNAEGKSLLYCKSTIRVKPNFEEVNIPDISLGTNPISISGNRKYGSSATDYFNNLVIGVQKAEYPVIMVDSREFTPSLLYNKSSFIGDQSNFVFEPTVVQIDRNFPVIYTVSGGKMYVLEVGVIGLPALYNDPMDYYIQPGGLGGSSGNSRYYFTFYDAKNKAIRVVNNGSSAGLPYSFTTANDDQTDPAKYLNQSFLVGQLASVSGSARFMYLMKENDKLYSYAALLGSDTKVTSFIKIASGTAPGDGNVGFAYYELGDNFWYVTNNKVVYRASHLGLEFQSFIELPSDAPGIITKYKKANGKIMIATFDQAYPSAKKGSVYIFDETTRALELSLPHSVEEIVDIHVGN